MQQVDHGVMVVSFPQREVTRKIYNTDDMQTTYEATREGSAGVQSISSWLGSNVYVGGIGALPVLPCSTLCGLFAKWQWTPGKHGWAPSEEYS